MRFSVACIVACIAAGVASSPVNVNLFERQSCSTPPAGGGTSDTPWYICGAFDGKGATYDTKKDYSGNCGGESGTTGAVFIIANGGSVKNVVIGGKQREGIHCKGSCTVSNVQFKNICEDILTVEGPGTVTFQDITASGGKDKVIQHNGAASVTLKNIKISNHQGKIYRSCASGGCNGYTGNRKVTATGITVSGGKVSEILGIKPGDTANFSGLTGAPACNVLNSSGSVVRACVQGKN